MHEQMGFAGHFFHGAFQEPEVALDLVAVAHHFIRIAMVDKGGLADAVGQAPFGAAHFHAAEHLLMHAAEVKQAGCIAIQPGYVGEAAGFAADIHERQAPGHDGGVLQGERQFFPAVGGQFLVRIQHENPIAGGVFQSGVAGGAEIIAPDKVMHLRAVFPGDRDGAVGRAGVHHHNLGGETVDGLQAAGEEALLIFNDETQ